MSSNTDLTLHFAVTQFLYREARLLDQQRYQDWLALLAEDIHYWAPLQFNNSHQQNLDLSNNLALFDDDRTSLQQRVQRLQTGRAWAEQPPSRTQRLINNIEVSSAQNDTIGVFSAFVLYRSRVASDADMLFGRREDRLRQVEHGFEITRRKITLIDTVLPVKNISTFL